MKWIKTAAQIIYDKKGINLLALDVRGLSTITNYMLIAEGEVHRHVVSMGKAILESLKQEGKEPMQIEGLEIGDWVVLDFPGFMVHLFAPGLRDLYQLEKIWPQSKLVELELKEVPSSYEKNSF